jgi:lysozyme family protein
MSDFNTAVELILKHEGGYVDHPEDPGGETKFGISKRAYPDLEIASLSEHDAKEIYREDYWNKIKGDELPFPLALLTFDAAVNSGRKRASKWLQQAVSAKCDGIIGDKTVESAWVHYGRNPDSVVQSCAHARMQFLEGLRTFRTFGTGWTRRVNETLKEAEKWIENS